MIIGLLNTSVYPEAGEPLSSHQHWTPSLALPQDAQIYLLLVTPRL